MRTLSDEFLDQCPVEDGFRLRGHKMSRMDVFIDAAFAFAVTMLMISFDRIPQTFEEIVLAIKGVPAFSVAVIQLVWIWRTHCQWSERFGLRTTMTVSLGTTLLIVMLVYIYPMRIMFAGMFAWMTDGYLPASFSMSSYDELRLMFIFLGSGLATLCLIFYLMYRHAVAKREFLRLSQYEHYQSETSALVWLGSIGVCLLSIALALILPPELVHFAGFGYALFSVWVPAVISYRMRSQPENSAIQD